MLLDWYEACDIVIVIQVENMHMIFINMWAWRWINQSNIQDMRCREQLFSCWLNMHVNGINALLVTTR